MSLCNVFPFSFLLPALPPVYVLRQGVYLSPGQGVPPSQDRTGLSPHQDRTGVPPARTGPPPPSQDRIRVPPPSWDWGTPRNGCTVGGMPLVAAGRLFLHAFKNSQAV